MELTISLSPAAKSFIDQQVAAGQFPNPSLMIEQLVQAAAQNNVRQAITSLASLTGDNRDPASLALNQTVERLLDQAEASGEPDRWTQDDVEDIRREIRQRYNQVGAKP